MSYRGQENSRWGGGGGYGGYGGGGYGGGDSYGGGFNDELGSKLHNIK